MTELPFELVIEILARVPVKDLLRFRCVCFRWRVLFRTKRFIRQHITHAPTRILSFDLSDNPLSHFAYESGKPGTILQEVKLNVGDESLFLPTCSVIGHCHGLLCLDLDEDNTFAVWNPSLRELRRILLSPRTAMNLIYRAETGFGYDHSTHDYKIVWLLDIKGSCRKAQVFCLTSGVSRMVDFPCLEKISMCHMTRPGTLVGQNIYWQVYDDKVDLTETILSFDLVSETFNYCQGPSTCGQHFTTVVEGLRGGLCTVGVDSCGDLIVWSAQHEKDNNSVIKSWSKIFTLSRGFIGSSISRPIDMPRLRSAVTYEGILLFVVGLGRGAKLLAYNLEEKSLTSVETSLSIDTCGFICTYVETLVRIPGQWHY